MLIEIIFWGALAVIAGALADKAEKRGKLAAAIFFILLALWFCGLGLLTGLDWAVQIKGVM